jgi:hypothetical protein
MAQALGQHISLRYPAEYGEKPASPLTMAFVIPGLVLTHHPGMTMF